MSQQRAFLLVLFVVLLVLAAYVYARSRADAGRQAGPAGRVGGALEPVPEPGRPPLPAADAGPSPGASFDINRFVVPTGEA